MIFGLTPSQTVGPYFAIGLPWPEGPHAVAEGTPGAFTITGTVYDGAGQPVPDHLIEIWQADPEGRFADLHGHGGPSETRRVSAASPATASRTATGRSRSSPSSRARAGGRGRLQAPHIDVSVFARGMLHRVRHPDLLRR